MNRFVFMIALILSVLIGNTPASAKLIPAHAKDIVVDSELIVVAVPKLLIRDTPGEHGRQAGQAELIVLETLKGKAPGMIRIGWGDEVHDQPIANLFDRYLLFLKKEKDGRIERFVPARYGMSYWALAHMRDEKNKTWDWATMTSGNVNFNGTNFVRSALTWLPGISHEVKVNVVFLNDLRQMIKGPK